VAALFRRPFHFGGIAVLVMLWLVAATVVPATRAAAAPFAAVVMDARSGEIMHSVNDRTRLHPASLTKMMTLYIAFEAVQNGEISLDTQITVSRRAAAEVPSKLGLRSGQRIALRYLIRGAALRSGNDAATAIAEGISGSVEAFAARMTRTAAAIGMTQTTFRNAHGLTQSGHLSSARDMALMARQLYFDYPQYYNLFSRRSENAGVAHVRNTNWRFLDGYRGADGIKTGYTRAAGYNLAASAQRGGKHVIVVVFGGRSTVDRHQRIVELMDRGFRQAPERVAIRRPSPPDYSRTPPVVVAEAPGAGGQSAARVVRMQPAPARSPVPQRRPGADLPDVPEELIASLQNSINEALASANQPVGETIVTEEAVQAALAAAPDSSLAPAARPETAPTLLAEAVEEALETEAEAETETAPETEIALADAEAAGFSVIDAETYAALTEDGADTLALDLGRDPEPETEAGNEALLESELAAAGPEPRPELAAPDVESDAVDAVVAEAAEATGTTLPDDLTRASLAPAVPAEPGAGMPEGGRRRADPVAQRSPPRRGGEPRRHGGRGADRADHQRHRRGGGRGGTGRAQRPPRGRDPRLDIGRAGLVDRPGPAPVALRRRARGDSRRAGRNRDPQHRAAPRQPAVRPIRRRDPQPDRGRGRNRLPAAERPRPCLRSDPSLTVSRRGKDLARQPARARTSRASRSIAASDRSGAPSSVSAGADASCRARARA
jgi:D-alanyl-D-alanine carboxypeptidase